MNAEISLPVGIDKRHEDLLGPLMPYCTVITSDYIQFRVPMKLLSGTWNHEVIHSLFDSIEIENDIVENLPTQNSYCVEMQLGDWKTIKLSFKEPLNPSNQRALLR